MARPKKVDDLSTLKMALVGYQIEQQKIETKIREIQAQLKGQQTSAASTASAGSTDKPARKKRELSPAARRRIAAAQKKRWAEHRKKLAQTAKAEE